MGIKFFNWDGAAMVFSVMRIATRPTKYSLSKVPGFHQKS